MTKLSKIIVFLFILNFFIFTPILTSAQIIEAVIPGVTEGEGKHFEITNSTYLNITLDSSESIKLRIESIPEMVTMMFEKSALTLANQTQITIKGFVPSTTYYLYEDDYHNLTEFTADENGSYIYTQDLSEPHFIFIQTQKSTKFIKDDATGGDCNSIGAWDITEKTCTLNVDLNETIQIDNNGITLDGNGHEISGGNTGSGIYFREKFGITIKNTTLRNFSKGISFRYSYQNILNNNSISNTYEGISGWYSANNTLSKNKFLSNNDGICLYYSDNNNLSNNIILNNNYDGVGFYNSSNNTFVGNTVSNNHYGGMGLYTSNANTIIDNIILNSGSDGLSFYDSAENKVSGNNISNGGSDGVPLYDSYNNIFSKNIISNNFEGDGIPLYDSYNNIFTDNVISNNEGGVALYYSNNNKIYNNNFLDNSTQAVIYSSTGNIFNLNLSIAGNYWKNFDTPADGCNDVNNDHICDSPYIFRGGQDNLPWTKQDGWKTKTLSEQASELAKELIYQPYLWGGKGWDYNQNLFVSANEVKTGYHFYNSSKKSVDLGVGVDCSGLVMWAYDRSFDPNKSRFNNFVKAESADEQYDKNTEPITESELKPGDVMFFDWDSDNHINHVAMYVGESDGYDVVNARSRELGIRGMSKNILKELPEFVAFKQIVSVPPPAVLVSSHSPVDLIVTDPDRFTITPTTTIPSDTEYLREIPGVLYYSEMERGEDGNPIDRVYSYVAKTGDYNIKVVPDFGALPTATYTLDFSVGDQSIILASSTPISQIPDQGYGVTTSVTGTISSFVPVAIDIKPGSYPNSINLKSNGVVPVAILGSATFNVKQIDTATIKLAGAKIKANNKDKLNVSYSDVNNDGFIDVLIKISTTELQLTINDTQANLEGQLISGTIIKGSDSIRIVP